MSFDGSSPAARAGTSATVVVAVVAGALMLLVGPKAHAQPTRSQPQLLPTKRTHEVFRVFPYLLQPSATGITVNWFTEGSAPGTLLVALAGAETADTLRFESRPSAMPALGYTEKEEAARTRFPDMFSGGNYKHSVRVEGLTPGQSYRYVVRQGPATYAARFETAPRTDTDAPVRFTVFADSETGPKGRTTRRTWAPGAQAPGSTGRPDSVKRYLLTEAAGFQQNLQAIQRRAPDFLLLAGDIVQGGGYQRAWDEFFFHTAGKFGNLLSSVPLLPAIGNWENYGGEAYEKGYAPAAVAASRAKYAAYFDAPPNGTPAHRSFYYRTDYGPVTILTLDSSNGLPDSTDQDTNIHINAATYPGDDLPDLGPGSRQWQWAERALREAWEKRQVIFVQFHHVPYSSGGHSLPLTAEGSSGQAGIPMRAYTPLFKKYGVAAVFSGHNESFEHSVVEGIHFYDVGVAGDGFGYALDELDARFENPHRVWVAHHDAVERWNGAQLAGGGKHYGHLEVTVTPSAGDRFDIQLTPVYLFPVTDEHGQVTGVERRTYDDAVEFSYAPRTGDAR